MSTAARDPFEPIDYRFGEGLGLDVRGDRERWAAFSPCERYRYVLGRTWNDLAPVFTACCLNPSTATESQDDPTVRRLIDFARRLGYGSLLLVNAFAWRATDPRVLRDAVVAHRYHPLDNPDAVGPVNSEVIRMACDGPMLGSAVAGWGAPKWKVIERRLREVRLTPRRRVWHCLGKTRDGHPRHPLYLPKSAALEVL